jgi:hypothetical protein
MVTLKFHDLALFKEFLKRHIKLVESFNQNTAVLIEKPGSSPYDNAELLEGIDYEFGKGFTYVH